MQVYGNDNEPPTEMRGWVVAIALLVGMIIVALISAALISAIIPG